MSKKSTIRVNRSQPSLKSFLSSQPNDRIKSPPKADNSNVATNSKSPSIFKSFYQKKNSQQIANTSDTIELSSDEATTPTKVNPTKNPIKEDMTSSATSIRNLTDPDAVLQKLSIKYGARASPSKPKAKSVAENIISDPKYIAINKKLEENIASLAKKFIPVKEAEVIQASPLSEINGGGKFRFKTAKATSLINGTLSLPLETTHVTIPETQQLLNKTQTTVPTRIPSPDRVKSPKPKFENRFKKETIKSPDILFRPSKFFQSKSPGEPVKVELKSSPKNTKIEKKLPQNGKLDTSPSSTTICHPSSSCGFTIKMDSSIKDTIDQVFNSSAFQTKSNPSSADIQQNISYLKEAMPNVLGEYFKVMNQIPIKFFENITGFDTVLFLKLKSVVHNIQAKLLQNERRLKTVSENKTEPPKRISRVEPLSLEELETYEEEDDYELGISARDYLDVSSSSYSNPSNATLSSKPNCTVTSGALNIVNGLDDNDDEIDRLVNESNTSSIFKFKQPRKPSSPGFVNQGNVSNYMADDDYDLEEIINNVEESKRIDMGKPKRTSIIELDDLPNNSRSTVTTSSFNPRINFGSTTGSSNFNNFEAASSSTSNTTNNFNPLQGTQLIETFETELDDDGWEKFDINSLEDCPMSQEAFYGFHTANEEISIQKQKQNTLNKLIPAHNDKTVIQAGDTLGKFHAGVHNDALSNEFKGYNFSHSQDLKLKFAEKFGLTNFRPNQLEAINATLKGYDCFILMPTGGGKSLCYQLPALMTRGVTFVISPLKSLILDQVSKLQSLDIPATHLSGTQSAKDIELIYRDLESNLPTLKLVYITPEKIAASQRITNIFDKLHKNNLIGRFVIDEAHCVSQWGHDFRPDYKKLGVLKERYRNTPMMALTATANPRVRIDVLKQLGIKNCKWFLCSFNRPNLKYIVLPKKGASTTQDMVDLIKSKFPRDSGIIYCLSRKECETTAGVLKRSGIKATAYHAGFSDADRESAQKDWITDKFKVVCATIAFGMGIDKSNVRYVLHFCMPKSIEGYYQESGRAGRDGEIATCILYYSYRDMQRYISMLNSDDTLSKEAKQVSIDNLKRIVNYCENKTDCRRTQQLDYFAEFYTREQCLQNRSTACDNCLHSGQYKEQDVTAEAQAIANAIRELCCGSNRYTLLHMIEVFKGSMIAKIKEKNHDKNQYHGKLKDWDRSDISRLLHRMIMDDFLREDFIFVREIPQPYIRLGTQIDKLMKNQLKITFSLLQNKSKGIKKAEDKEPTTADGNSKMLELIAKCQEDLLNLCRKISTERNCPMGSILPTLAIKQLAAKMPETKEEMLKIPHVTQANFEKFGKEFLEITVHYSAEKLIWMMDQEMEMESAQSKANSISTPEVDWSQYSQDESQTQRGGFNRKRKFGGRQGSATKKFKRRRTTPKKRAAKGGTPKKRGGAAKKSSGFGLMPMPTFKN